MPLHTAARQSHWLWGLGLACLLISPDSSPAQKEAGRLLLTLGGGGHTSFGSINRVQFSPDGKRLVALSKGGSIQLLDAATGDELLTLTTDSGAADVTFSPNGKRLVSGHPGGLVRVWDAGTGRELLPLGGDDAFAARCLAFSPSGRYLACTGRGNTVKIWELVSRRPVVTLRRPAEGDNSRDFICDVAYSPDGRLLAAADTTTGHVTVWDAVGGKVLHSLDVRNPDSVWDMGFAMCKVVFSPDGRHLATAGGKHDHVKIWTATTGKLLRSLPGGLALAFSPDGGHLAQVTPVEPVLILIDLDGKTISREPVEAGGEIQIWDVGSGKQVASFKANAGNNVCGIAFSPDGRRLALVNREDLIKVWDVAEVLPDQPPR
jgi:WD40 repeat protein